FVPDEQGRVLLVHRADNDLHTLPGGRQEIGETISAAAVAEPKGVNQLERAASVA
ncbi:NUDIX hydrolase, partial [Kibdelosporangium lantanae]